MNKIREALQSNAVRGSRTMMLLVVLTVILAVLAVSLGSKAILSYREAQDVKAQTQEMEDTLKDWKAKSTAIDHEKYRPVKGEQVDTVNSDILFKLQSNNLKITDYKAAVSTGKNTNAKTFELSFDGQYGDAIRFLSDFHSRDALMNLTMLKLNPAKGLIHGQVRYRIYTK